PTRDRFAQAIQRLGVRQLRAVAALELGPLGRVVPEPPAQLPRGRHVLRPQVQVRLVLRHAPRPQAVDQHAETVVRPRRLVYTLHPKPRHGHSPGRRPAAFPSYPELPRKAETRGEATDTRTRRGVTKRLLPWHAFSV